MNRTLILAALALVLGGCAIVPAGYGDSRDGYYRDRGYERSDGNYRDNRYRGDRDDRGYRDHGG